MADPQNLSILLKDVQSIRGDAKDLSIAEVVEHLGRRAFGPLLLLAALPTLTPISTIPGVATVGAVIILLAAGQMAFGQERLWLPAWLSRRRISRSSIKRVMTWVRPIASFVDKLIRPRLTWLVQQPYLFAIAVACILLAFVMFPLQLVPFTSGIPSFPVALFGLAMLARDGVLVIAGLVSAAVVLAASVAFLMLGVNLI